MFGLIGSVKTLSKVLGVGMNVGPYMAYICIYILFLLYTKKRGVFGGPKIFIMSFWHFLSNLALKMADFLKLELFLRPFL